LPKLPVVSSAQVIRILEGLGYQTRPPAW